MKKTAEGQVVRSVVKSCIRTIKMIHSEITNSISVDIVLSEDVVSQCEGKENRKGGRHFHDNVLELKFTLVLTEGHPAAVREKCPWYFKMKAIIDECPSLVPVGLGTNNSAYDVSLLALSANTLDFDFSDGLGLETEHIGDNVDGGNGNSEGEGEGEGDDDDDDDDGEGEGGNSDVEEDVPAKAASSKVAKCKADLVETMETKKTSAQSGKSAPVITATAAWVSKKPQTGIGKINAITAKEEEMTQKVLELKKLKVKGENDKVLVKIQAKADLKMQGMKLQADLVQKKMDNEFHLQMAQMGHASAEAGPSNMMYSSVATSSSGYSDAGSATPSTFSNDLQLDQGLDFQVYSSNSGYNFMHMQDEGNYR
jgi:hypothetical protein